MQSIDVSVVVAVCNVADTIRACLDSIIRQTGVTWEIICVDNASEDASSDILDEYASRDSRIRIIHNSQNVGLLESRHIGSAAAKGEYLVFVDGDDELLDGGLTKAVQAIRAKAVDVLVFALEFNVVGDVHLPSFEEYFRLKGEVDNEKSFPVLRSCFLSGNFSWNSWNKIYKTSLVKKAMNELKGDFIVQGEDVYLTFLIGTFAKSGAVLNEPIYRYRIGAGLSTDRHLRLENFRLYLAYVTGVRRAADFSKRVGPHPIVDAAFMRVVENARRVIANVINNRLAKEYRDLALKELQKLTEELNLGGLFMTDIDNEEILRLKIRAVIERETQPLIEDWERRLAGLQQELDAVKGSLSYRVGKLVTFPIRKIKNILKPGA